MLAFAAAIAVSATPNCEETPGKLPLRMWLIGEWVLPSLGSPPLISFEFFHDGRVTTRELMTCRTTTCSYTLKGDVLEIRWGAGDVERWRFSMPTFTDSEPPCSFNLLTWQPGTPAPKGEQRTDALFRQKPPPPSEDLPRWPYRRSHPFSYSRAGE